MINANPLILILVLMLGGCASVREFLGFSYARPEFSLKGIEVKNISLDSVDLMVVVRVKNPNSFDINLQKLDYKVAISGVPLAAGVFDKKVSFKAEGFETVRLPLTVNSKNARTLLNSLVDDPNKELTSVLSGTAVFDSPVGKIEHAFVDEAAFGDKKKPTK